MVQTRSITACVQRRVFWLSGHSPECADATHDHPQVEVHRHLDTVVLPDRTELVAASFDLLEPYRRDRVPDYGLYLDRRWQPPWLHDHVDWPDFGVPPDSAPVEAALRTVLDRARAGQRVEVGCTGGHGRTGTALAWLAVLTGHPADDAVSWVRSSYCPDAVETDDQAALIAQLDT